MWDYKAPSDEWLYFYTADDERAWSYKTDNTSLWTLRGPDAKVLREYTNNGTWTVAADSIYRSGLLLATETPQGTRHLHLDHLGTPRLISNSVGNQTAYHVYYPFGEEATAFNQDTLRAKFTGHERDLGNASGAGDDLDYMHARHESPVTGRFLSMDRVGGKPKQPQSWNRYEYAYDNPIKYVDPNGQDGLTFGEYGAATYEALARTTDQLAFGFAYPYFKIQSGILNDDPVDLAKGVGLIAVDALSGVAGDAIVAGRGAAVARSAAVASESEILLSFSTKAAAREGVASLGLNEVQAASVNRTIGRATATSRLDIVLAKDGSVVVQTTRAGRNGYQVIQTIIDKNGEKKVVQLAYDAAGKLVHFDPKK